MGSIGKFDIFTITYMYSYEIILSFVVSVIYSPTDQNSNSYVRDELSPVWLQY